MLRGRSSSFGELEVERVKQREVNRRETNGDQKHKEAETRKS